MTVRPRYNPKEQRLHDKVAEVAAKFIADNRERLVRDYVEAVRQATAIRSGLYVVEESILRGKKDALAVEVLGRSRVSSQEVIDHAASAVFDSAIIQLASSQLILEDEVGFTQHTLEAAVSSLHDLLYKSPNPERWTAIKPYIADAATRTHHAHRREIDAVRKAIADDGHLDNVAESKGIVEATSDLLTVVTTDRLLSDDVYSRQGSAAWIRINGAIAREAVKRSIAVAGERVDGEKEFVDKAFSQLIRDTGELRSEHSELVLDRAARHFQIEARFERGLELDM